MHTSLRPACKQTRASWPFLKIDHFAEQTDPAAKD
jgi:hypothetical protein